MKSHKWIPTLALILGSSFSVPLWAQQVQQQSGGAATPIQPISTQANTGNASGAVPAAHGLFVGYEPADANDSAAQLQPDDHLLSGVESFSLGILRSFTATIDPSLFVTESADTGDANGRWDTTATSIGGGFALTRDWSHARIGVQYFGAQSFYTPNSIFDGAYHTLGFSQSMSTGRWSFVLHDSLMFTQSAGFTSLQSGLIAPTSGIGSGSALQPGLAPASTINTGPVGTLNNAATGQIAYALSRRTSITVAGVYGALHFSSSGYIDSRSVSGSVGYNYALSPLNSMAVQYSFGENNFSGSAAGIDSHTVLASFGRKITGKLAFQASGGPQVVELLGTSGAPTTSTLSWSANASVTYGPWPRGVSYSATYSHGLTGGSGVLYGSESDTGTGSVRFGFARYWSASVNGGYVANRALTNATTGATQYNTWIAGASLTRPISRKLSFSFNYQYQHQDQNGTCPVLSCGINPGNQALSGRLEWHPWPARLE